ncbi:enoyl-CoA hydratase/isomerase family protein [Desulfoscipio gibsoniae]|uniref:short-chain-enoyl-CoA hydratase n=1 Tax=Desulfoscipio gibsoniae DSM 7213 TaxID=767817 RepID=R4KBW5_9FIRM|nr:enoyl-CoA hydratase-related protein [Desulfoscipio gibsoniae]AGL00044.1 enoyl-CoA hydratase/carnithine racemase [Desulfoscipio gibsoniae DSM 7213]
MGYSNLLLEKENGIALLTLNRPEVNNALDRQTWLELGEAIKEVQADVSVRVLIITGAGERAFAAGADVRWLKERPPLDLLERGPQAIMCELERMPKPVIAAINGYALGGGCELAMACDVRIACEKAKFGQPEINLGILPGGGGTQRLSQLVGKGKAKELIFTGDIIDAREAEKIGLVNKVVPAEQLMSTAMDMARKMAGKSPVALRVVKSVIDVGTGTDFVTALAFEQFGQTILWGTEDRVEGMEAFLSKRSAKFTGK